MKANNVKNFAIAFVSILLWSIITLVRLFHHTPWFDEAHAWVIAHDLNFVELIKYVHKEGHTFLWYLILMPFAKFNFYYPYPMQILNWIFCFVAMIILWWKAPFNNAIKFLISFSFPFLGLYPILARCYAIGIMFLFIIASMEKKKLEHPVLYSTLLVLCANTSVMAMAGAGAFGLIFIYDLIKEKNRDHIIKSFSIMLLGLMSIAVQFLGVINTKSTIYPENLSDYGIDFFNGVFVYNALEFNITLLLVFIGLLIYFFIVNKTFSWFLFITYFCLIVVEGQYAGNIWHNFFFYIYFIIFVWLTFDKFNKNLKQGWILTFILFVTSIFYIGYKINSFAIEYFYKNESKVVSNYILNNEEFKNSRIIVTDFFDSAFSPYLSKRSDIEIYNYCAQKKFDYDYIAFIDSKNCHKEKMQ